MKVAHEVVGSGEPLLLVSGIGQTGKRWRRVVDVLRDDYTCVTFDNRGVGGTGVPDEPFTLTDIAQDALDLMSELGHERFFLAGISMGGMISQEIIRLSGRDRIRAAVLLATHPGSSVAVLGDVGVLVARPGDDRPTWARLSGPGFAEAHPDVIAEETQLSIEQGTTPLGFLRQAEAIRAWDPPEDALRNSGVPVAVAHGDHDPLVPYENGVLLAERVGVELITYEGTGHVLECERVAEITALMRAHFGAH